MQALPVALPLEVPRKSAKKVKRAEVMSELQARLLGDLQRYMKQKGITKTSLEADGGPSQQVLNKMEHGSSPQLRTLEKLAVALNTELIVAIPGVSDPHGVVAGEKNHRERDLKRETADVVEWMEGGSDELRADIRKLVQREILGRASHPLDADGEQAGPLARNR